MREDKISNSWHVRSVGVGTDVGAEWINTKQNEEKKENIINFFQTPTPSAQQKKWGYL